MVTVGVNDIIIFVSRSGEAEFTPILGKVNSAYLFIIYTQLSLVIVLGPGKLTVLRNIGVYGIKCLKFTQYSVSLNIELSVAKHSLRLLLIITWSLVTNFVVIAFHWFKIAFFQLYKSVFVIILVIG